MPTLDELQKRTADFLTSARPSAAPLAVDGAFRPAEPFSEFNPQQMQEVAELASEMTRLANETAGPDGVAAALDAAEMAAAERPVELVKHALMTFIVHHSEARQLAIPALIDRQPETVGDALAVVTPRTDNPDSVLNWFREDLFLNEHHSHWHIVYPNGGISRDGIAPRQTKDRQGELFVYMHQQMLARYDTERLAAGLDRVEPFADYRAVITWGYDPMLRGFSARPDNSRWLDDPRSVQLIPFLEAWRDALERAVESGRFFDDPARPVEVDGLGSTLEATIGSVDPASAGDPFAALYGNLHNFGHGRFASLSPGGAGCMGRTSTAVRDHVFWEWHRHIDDFVFGFPESLAPHPLDDGPEVVVRNSLADGDPAVPEPTGPELASPDLILARLEAVPGADQPDFDGAAWGEAEFGGARWDEDFSVSAVSTDELVTRIYRGMFRTSIQPNPFPHDFLHHDPFAYFIRVENRAADVQNVTVRIFLVAASEVEDRRMWIEMDRFSHDLPAASKSVIYRPGNRSAVIKKRDGVGPWPPIPVSPEERVARRFDPDGRDEDYCDCGWPYNLLVPRGTEDGMDFVLGVVITDGDLDTTAGESRCGSRSLCGALWKPYPDSREMGYPFSRPFAGAIADTLVAQPAMAARHLRIRHEPGVRDLPSR